MTSRPFSKTAIIAAALRAAHQSADGGFLLRDPIAAYALLPEDAETLRNAAEPAIRPLRLFVALRSRIAEDAALAALEGGARQVVILGPGLDTFAHRLAPRPGLRIYELDHAATWAEKLRRFTARGLASPEALIYVPCDFETSRLAQALDEAGFEAAAPAMFIALGVFPYLTPESVAAVLRFIASAPGGADLVFDYGNPVGASASPGRRLFHERMAALAARNGEPFRSEIETAQMHAQLWEAGFARIDDWGPLRVAERLGDAAPESDEGGHIVFASSRLA